MSVALPCRPRYSFSAYCVPNDAISNFADTKGLPMGYTGVNQVLNRNAGELVYAAEGYLGFCYDGILAANSAELFVRRWATLGNMGPKIVVPQMAMLVKEIMASRSMTDGVYLVKKRGVFGHTPDCRNHHIYVVKRRRNTPRTR